MQLVDRFASYKRHGEVVENGQQKIVDVDFRDALFAPGSNQADQHAVIINFRLESAVAAESAPYRACRGNRSRLQLYQLSDASTVLVHSEAGVGREWTRIAARISAAQPRSEPDIVRTRSDLGVCSCLANNLVRVKLG